MIILYLILAAVPLFFLWATIHELSHYFAARIMVPIEDVKIKVWPHKANGNFYWARVQWKYVNGWPTENQQAWKSFAPRWMNILAALLFPLGFLFDGWGGIVWMSIWGGGLIDFANGSIGMTERSDLQRFSKLWKISPWVFRILGWCFVLASVIIGIILKV